MQVLLARESGMLAAAVHVDVPVPEVMDFQPNSPAVLITRQLKGSELSSSHPQAARETGRYLKRFHEIGASPPFAGGEATWGEHVISWADHEIDSLMKKHSVFDKPTGAELKARFAAHADDFSSRPVVLLHGDFQTNHVLVDPDQDKVNGFIDFVDAQPGDPLWDIAVVSLWDESLSDAVLEGYGDESLTHDAQVLLSEYRLLRHIAEIPWRLERGYRESAQKNIVAVMELLEKA